jgi:hypothetical protein
MTITELKEKLKGMGIETDNLYPKTSFLKDGVPHIGMYEREFKEDFYFHNKFDNKIYKVPKPTGALKDIYEGEIFQNSEKFLVPEGDWVQVEEEEQGYVELEDEAYQTMTIRDYACIQLRIPESNKDWLNKLIKSAK